MLTQSTERSGTGGLVIGLLVGALALVGIGVGWHLYQKKGQGGTRGKVPTFKVEGATSASSEEDDAPTTRDRRATSQGGEGGGYGTKVKSFFVELATAKVQNTRERGITHDVGGGGRPSGAGSSATPRRSLKRQDTHWYNVDNTRGVASANRSDTGRMSASAPMDARSSSAGNPEADDEEAGGGGGGGMSSFFMSAAASAPSSADDDTAGAPSTAPRHPAQLSFSRDRKESSAHI